MIRRKILKVWLFLTQKIWRFDATEKKGGIKSLFLSWLKALMLAGRVFRHKEIWRRDIPSLTYSTLMALIPLLALMYVIARGFGVDDALEGWINDTLEAQPTVSEYIVGFVHNYLSNTKSNYIIGVGAVMMLYTFYNLMHRIETTFNAIWHVQQRRFARRLTDYTAVFFFCGLMILVASGLNIMAVSLAKHLTTFAGKQILVSILLQFATLLPLFAFFVFIYSFIPNTYTRIRCILIPALLASMCISLLQYSYISVQVWLASYNAIYGSLAALPLFLIWIYYSWTICLFFAVLSYSNQNIHRYDYNVDYTRLRHDKQVKICAILMHHICLRFKQGQTAYTPRDLHVITHIPQQVVSDALRNLIDAKLLVEIKSKDKGLREEMCQLHPIERIANLTYGTLIERLDHCGDDIKGLNLNALLSEEWDKIETIRQQYLREARTIQLSEI